MSSTKICSKCGLEKDVGFFYKNRKVCKNCIKQYRHEYHIKNKEKYNTKSKMWDLENKDRIRKYKKIYRKNNLDKFLKYRREYYLKNIDRELNKCKEYRGVNKNRIKAYLLKNKNIKNKNIRDRKKRDPAFRFRKLVSSSISKQLNNNYFKHGSVWDYLDYTPQGLKLHIEAFFTDKENIWMNWTNHGIYNPNTWDDNDQSTWTWQLDHIEPHSKFKYSSLEDESFKKCWLLVNLRPLSAKQNFLDGILRTRH